MNDCKHSWKMTSIEYGFTVFERCTHCQDVRTYFASQDTWDDYKEDACHWSIVENAQTIRFDLQCESCKRLVKFDDLLGLLYCTSCLDDCQVECIRKGVEAQRTLVMVAFGYLPHSSGKPFSQEKLDILEEYFNQRRDTSISRVKILPFNLIKKVSLCRGEFLHDVGMLSPEPVVERKPLL